MYVSPPFATCSLNFAASFRSGFSAPEMLNSLPRNWIEAGGAGCTARSSGGACGFAAAWMNRERSSLIGSSYPWPESFQREQECHEVDVFLGGEPRAEILRHHAGR